MISRSRAYWICQTAGWSAHALISLAFAALPSGVLDAKYALAILWAEALAGYSSHLLRGWIHRHHWLDLPPMRVIPRVLVGSLACGAGVTAITTITSILMGFNRDPAWNWWYLLSAFFVWSVVVFLWEVIYFAVGYFERYSNARVEQLRLAVAAKDSELRALLAQVNPHFIFNCLTGLRALAIEDPPRAQDMIDQLSSLLRYSLQSGRSETVPLEREMEAIRAYLRLETMRFEDRLKVSVDVDPRSLAVSIPPMLVQMLVENAVKHGIAHLARGGEICVSSRIESDVLKIQVMNSGQLIGEPVGSTAIGLNNSRERLRILYGASASLALRNATAGSVVAEVLVPIRGAIPA